MIGEVAARLEGAYPSVPATTIRDVVCDLHSRFNGAPIREFVPLLVERMAHNALSELSVSWA